MAGTYLVLARKWRPTTFEEVVGQEHITRTLQNAIAAGRVGHAFLFIGSRGIGKTTTARILAKALNCEAAEAPTPNPCCECENCRTIGNGTNIDVVEIDGASNNGVDDVRQIRENIRLVPSRSRYKVYIIDEVHQLSLGAFNALLKTLEEPPAHAVFILATTEAHKVPATIISRCQRYDFRRVNQRDLTGLLTRILESEGIACSPEAVLAIARAADGGIRDAESILEQLISYCGDAITFTDVHDVLGLVDHAVLHGLCDALVAKDIGTLLRIVEDVNTAGKDLPQFIQELLRYFRNLLVTKVADAEALLGLPPDELAAYAERAGQFSVTELIRIVEQLADLFKRDFDVQLAPRIALETLLIRMAAVSVDVSLDSVLDKLARLGAGGVGQGSPPAAPAAPSPARAKPARAQAPPAAAPERSDSPVEATETNMAKVWRAAAARAGDGNMNIKLANLEAATPEGIDGDTLRVGLPADAAHARSIIEKPEYRATIDAAVAAVSSNLRHVQFTVANGGGDEGGGAPPGQLPLSGAVRDEDARTALKHPHVALVMDVFKGKIIEIRRNATPTA